MSGTRTYSSKNIEPQATAAKSSLRAQKKTKGQKKIGGYAGQAVTTFEICMEIPHARDRKCKKHKYFEAARSVAPTKTFSWVLLSHFTKVTVIVD